MEATRQRGFGQQDDGTLPPLPHLSLLKDKSIEEYSAPEIPEEKPLICSRSDRALVRSDQREEALQDDDARGFWVVSRHNNICGVIGELLAGSSGRRKKDRYVRRTTGLFCKVPFPLF